MLSKSEGSNFWRYGWDYENRLTTASTRKQTVRYRYDALGRRVQRYFVRGGGENTKFIYDGLDVVMDDNSGVLTKCQNGLGIDNKLKMITNGQAKYFLQDHLGSTVGLADSSGNVVSSASYDSFGNTTNNLTTRYQYTGREKDEFTGLMYYRARWYDANLGRFISEDPIGFEGKDINWFSYVHNNPLMYFDPEGKQSRSDARWDWSREDNQKMIQAIQNMPNPVDTGRYEKLLQCHQRNKFSALFGGIPYGEGTVEVLEVGSVLSLGGDAIATGLKAGGKSFGQPQPYASGINMVTRNVNRSLGYPKIGGFYPYKYLNPIGNVATKGFLLFGAFTFSYNTTVDIQCICGQLE